MCILSGVFACAHVSACVYYISVRLCGVFLLQAASIVYKLCPAAAARETEKAKGVEPDVDRTNIGLEQQPAASASSPSCWLAAGFENSPPQTETETTKRSCLPCLPPSFLPRDRSIFTGRETYRIRFKQLQQPKTKSRC